MAQCPNCHAKLHLWNIKAECPHCHINIPNHNWEQRLEEDAQNREASFFKLKSNLQYLKYAVIGTPWRLVRLICAVLPLLGYLLPMAKIVTADGTRDFSAITMFTSGKDVFGVPRLLELYQNGTPERQRLLLALVLAAAALLFGVLAFFLIFLLYKHPKTPVLLIFHVLSLGLYTAGAMLARKMFAVMQAFDVMGGGLAIGAYLGVAAFALVLVLDVLLLALPVKQEALRYVPTDELQWDYALSVGAVQPEEKPLEFKK